MEKVKNSNTFIKGALLLTFGGIITKVLGAIYRIPLTNLLGTYAMGLYQLVFPLYGLLITVGIGFSIAVSKAVAKERQVNQCVSCKKILRCAFILLGGIGLFLSFLLYLFAPKIAIIQGNPLIANAYKILAPSIFLVCLSGALRGYFQGQLKMSPTVMSQIAEQVVKLVLGLIFAYNALPNQIKAVNGAILAVTISEALSLLVFYLYYLKEKRQNLYCYPLKDLSNKKIYRQLIKTAIPVTFGGVLAPLSQLIDSSLMLKLLTGDATRLYGIWSGPVHSLFAMPVMLSIGISATILPDVSGNVAVGNLTEVRQKVNLAIKLNTIIVLPCVLGFLFFSPQIISLLYSSLPIQDLLLSARLLSVVAIGSLFMTYTGTLSSVLQGVCKEYVSLLFSAIAIVIKTLINV
ncbi:MAG: polysaccharide biosynthesis protein, partial [Clostridia bacterium]|nr:polysaccharide biosynthesis protein [Clostridia bacterium]